MLIKPDNPPSQTTSYQPISLLSAIMKLFERVIEKRLRKHLEDSGFFSKCQSGFKGELQRENKFFHMKERSKCWRKISVSLESVKPFLSY